MSALRTSTWCAAGLLACGAVACKNGVAQPEHTRGVVALSELPPEHRRAWETWLAGGAAWELERERVRADPALARFVVDNLVRALIASYDRSALAVTGHAPGRFERARADLVALQAHSIPLLAGLLAVEDGIVAFLAADCLAEIGADAVGPVRAQLRAPRDETRRRAAELLGRLPHAAAAEIAVEQELAECVADDAAWAVRGEAALALGARAARHAHKGFARGVLTRALRDPDPAVAESAATGLLTLAEPSAIPGVAAAMDFASRNGRPRVVRACEQLLRVLSGDPRARSAAEWDAWWSERERTASSSRP